MSLVEPSCQYCTPNTGGHEASCPTRWPNLGLCDCRTAHGWHQETCSSRYPVARMLTGEPNDYPLHSPTPDAWRERAERAEAENGIWRRWTWLSHGHTAMYGDDGEMQCQGIDFRRDVSSRVLQHATQGVQDTVAMLTARVAELETLYTEKETEVWALVAVKNGLERRVAELEREKAELELAAETDRALASKMKAELSALRAVAEAAEMVDRDLRYFLDVTSLRNLSAALAAWRTEYWR